MPLNTYTINSHTLGGAPASFGTRYPARKLLTLRQSVYVERPARKLLTLRQWVAFRVTPARKLLTLRQQVVQTVNHPARKLLTLRQVVQRRVPARRLLTLRQQVFDPTAPVTTKVPAARVVIGKKDVTSQTKLMSQIVINHGEDQPSTAAFHLRFEVNAPISIPAFHGKTVEIYTYTDPTDANSELERLFTGEVNDARYDRNTRAVVFDCSNLRGEQLGEEDQQELLQLTQAVYSEMTQKEGAEGNEFVNEMMKTVAGSLGYTREGDLYYYSWGTDGKPVDWTFTDADVHRNDITVDFQTRDQIKNTVSISLEYRYYALRTVTTTVKGVKGLQDFFSDGKGSFLRESLVDRIQNGFSPWFAIDYELYNTPPVGKYGSIGVVRQRLDRGMGYTANLERYIAQPVTEHYEITVTAPQSVRAYRKEVKGTALSFAIESDFDTATFEDREAVYAEQTMQRPARWTQWPTGGTIERWADAVATATYLAPTTDGGQIPVADDKRPLFNAGFGVSVKIGAKEIIQSHRQNYIDIVCRKRIIPAQIGQVAHINTRVPNAIGQITGLTYIIGDGIRDTRVRTSISYMDDNGAVPAPNWDLPPVPALELPQDRTAITSPMIEGSLYTKGWGPGLSAQATPLIRSINYNTEDSSLDVSAGEVPEQLIDEAETKAAHTFEVPLENADITLINGW
ncbi:hypothetical protein [Marinobacterium stanieri]|uniref:Uncharacterized protein n=1 Tax=Marinobacterium stanieri TaxID=49186 RepID=A0A1N6QAV2_9GAMM|nr:hypothetical protein [Marinobacterium stanieri]SIQ13672.1 hypothetical protein SAMN05421647_102382 [Marinobacterium stanieri]